MNKIKEENGCTGLKAQSGNVTAPRYKKKMDNCDAVDEQQEIAPQNEKHGNKKSLCLIPHAPLPSAPFTFHPHCNLFLCM